MFERQNTGSVVGKVAPARDGRNQVDKMMNEISDTKLLRKGKFPSRWIASDLNMQYPSMQSAFIVDWRALNKIIDERIAETS